MPNIRAVTFDSFQSLDEKFEFTVTLQNQGNLEEALSYYRILKDEYENEKKYDKVLDCLGGICQNLGNLDRVNEMNAYLPEYKSYCSKYGDELSKFKLNFYIGYANFSVEEFEDALEWYDEALKIAKRLKDEKRELVVLMNLLCIYSLLEKFELALSVANAVEETYEKNPTLFSATTRAAFLLNYGTILLEIGQLEKAKNLLAIFEVEFNTAEQTRVTTYYNYIKGKLFYEEGNYLHAESYLVNSFNEIKVTKVAPNYHLTLRALIALYEKTNRYEEALTYSKILIESLHEKERIERHKITQKIAQQVDLEDIKELIYTDALTNIHNRRYVEEQGAIWIESAAHVGETLYCAVFDIDQFKFINDQYGHIIGDEVIKQLAMDAKQFIGDKGIFARYGGDEFIVLYRGEYPNTFFEELFQTLTNTVYINDSIEVRYTISMGVANLDQCEELELISLFSLADVELYRSKVNGKNKLSIKEESYTMN